MKTDDNVGLLIKVDGVVPLGQDTLKLGLLLNDRDELPSYTDLLPVSSVADSDR